MSSVVDLNLAKQQHIAIFNLIILIIYIYAISCYWTISPCISDSDAAFAWFMLIACFLNSLGTGSGLRCSVWHWAGHVFEVAVDLLWLDFYSSFLLCFDPSLISSMQLLTCTMHCDNKKKSCCSFWDNDNVVSHWLLLQTALASLNMAHV